MADRTVPSTLTDLEWIQSLGARLWLPRRGRSCRPRNGYRNPKLQITSAELHRVKRVIREQRLPCELQHTPYGAELAVYGKKGEIMRLTHHHIPSHSYNGNHRRKVAARLFASFTEELREQRTEQPTTN